MSSSWRKVVLAATVGMILALTAGAAHTQETQYAGEEITVTGPVSATDDPEAGRSYFIDDYATAGSAYKLLGDADFEAYVGQQATAYGVPGEPSISGLTPLYVSRIGPPEDGGYTIEEVTANFELAVEGDPSTEAAFWGNWGPNYAFGSVELTDPDGDSVYTGSQSASSPVDSDGVVGIGGPHPVWIEQRGTESTSVIEDFGEVALRAGENDFLASVSFDGKGSAAGSAEGERTEGSAKLTGTGGDDPLRGGYGDDFLRGRESDDLIIAEAGADEVYGGAGNDALYAAFVPWEVAPDAPASHDLLYGGEGDDFIDAADAAGAFDAVYCGAGSDLVVADLEDFVADDCEVVHRF